ncbi:hypothetical protein [Enterococcus olivae]
MTRQKQKIGKIGRWLLILYLTVDVLVLIKQEELIELLDRTASTFELKQEDVAAIRYTDEADGKFIVSFTDTHLEDLIVDFNVEEFSGQNRGRVLLNILHDGKVLSYAYGSVPIPFDRREAADFVGSSIDRWDMIFTSRLRTYSRTEHAVQFLLLLFVEILLGFLLLKMIRYFQL